MSLRPVDIKKRAIRLPLDFAADCRWVYMLILVLLVLWQPVHAAGVCAIGISQYSCSTVTVAGATSTVVSAVNAGGQLAGYYQLGNGSRHSFIQAGNGVLTALADPPGLSDPLAFGINTGGQIVGTGLSSAASRGFTGNGSTYTTLSRPGATNTYAFGINDAGTIVGASDGAGGVNGFLLSGGAFTSVAMPGANATYVYGINNAGTLAGTYSTSSGAVSGFTLQNGSFTSITVPGAQQTFVRGLNGLGDLVGEYVNSLGKTSGFVRLGSGEFWTFDIANALNTYAASINDARTVVGHFGSNNAYQGFIAMPVPVPLPATLPLLSAGLLLLARLRRRAPAATPS